ncbi:MAG: hypothetical protein ACN4GZ_17285 [Acidimicrobiales bacterium]
MQRPRRVSVVGNSGSGKSTLSKEIAGRLGCEHIELDAIHHLPNWTPIEREEMRRIVRERTEAESWVVDGNYGSLVQDIVFSRVDTVVWLDMPHRVTMSRVVRRTVGRGILRRELWNGNRESLRNLLKTEPEENIVLWAWTQRNKYRTKYRTAKDDAANAHLNWVHLTSPGDVRDWIATIS